MSPDSHFRPPASLGPPTPPAKSVSDHAAEQRGEETSNSRQQHTSTVVVADAKPLSLLATAGVLHHEGMRCICARGTEAVLKAFHLAPVELGNMDDSVQNRVDEKHEIPGEYGPPSGHQGSEIDLLVWDVGDAPMEALATIEHIRNTHPFQQLPVVILAESKWAGLEKKTELASTPTHCLFKPIDPKSLITIAQHLLWMPSLQATHRQRGTRPNRPGWVTL
ncbi:hypothetical protein LOC71_03050 [Rhodopirellula sp. JC740]|uniref:Response regulatory domain-containing protein n=1 Tax=Rhodopirellula halodulae TaxID=2894198 RepID=A0ABS8NCG1_9BACT|nr:hypothetical protein [Rhodopirellula sp. JC740]MCC9641237.1 hypothetical protein [Rhodopirellula sp. JC740]